MKRLPLVLAGLTLAACAGGDGAIRDGAPSSLDGPDHDLEWRIEPVFSIGGMEAEGWQAFGEIRALAFDGEGRLHVLDAQSNQVTVVGATGELDHRVGQVGQGPGELSRVAAMAVAPDGRVAVFDRHHGGFVVFDAQGRYLHTQSVDTRRLGAVEGALPFHPSGSILAALTRPPTIGPDAQTQPRYVALAPLHADSVARVIFEAWHAEAPRVVPATMPEAPGIRVRVPTVIAFEPGLHVAVLPDGRIVVVDSFVYWVKLLDASGVEVGALRRPVDPVSVTDAVRAAERRRLRLVLEQRGGPKLMMTSSDGAASAVPDEQARRFEDARIEGMTFHSLVPVVEALDVDFEGRIWVQRSGALPGQPGPTDVLTAEGVYLGSLPASGLRIPAAFGPRGLVAQIDTDDFDVPTVRVGRLVLLPPSTAN